MSTLFVHVPALEHTLDRHPESAERMMAIESMLETTGLRADLKALTPTAAEINQITRVHNRFLVEQVRQISLRGGGRIDADTYATPQSYDQALLAAGSVASAVDHLMMGTARNGFALVRPPGHHAESDRAMGFCLFNNIAVAARQAQAVHGVKRVMILDFDVHHGNGTQEIFYGDPSVLFVSLHLYGRFFYPGTGGAKELGDGPGQGSTLNVPLPPNVGDGGYELMLRELVWPKVAAFDPELILISAGYDAHWQDPLAYAGLSLTGYAQIARTLVEMAEEMTDGKVLFVLEGGYFHDALANGVLNTFYALMGRDQVTDPLGVSPEGETEVIQLLSRLQGLHLI